MEYKFTIPGRLDGLNDYTSANRTNPYKGAKMKAEAEKTVMYSIRQQLHRLNIKAPVRLKYEFWEPNKRRDLDNISSFAHKVIQDSLVKTGVLVNDNWDYIIGYEDIFYVDKNNPRIVVTMLEVGG